MKPIGIDASRTTVARRTGTEAYALQLTRALLALESPHRWRLYFRDAPAADLLPNHTHVEQRVIRAPRLWTHLGLAAEVSRRPPAGLFIPAHVRPVYCPVPTVVTVHDLGYLYFPDAHPRAQRAYLDWATRFSARHASHVIADSQATHDDLTRHYAIDPAKISVIYPGVDTRPFEARGVPIRHFDVPAGYLLHVGTLQPRKNLARLLDAVAALDDLVLVCAGQQGWLSESILNHAATLRLGDRVRFLDYVPEEALAALYAGAAAFVFPSLYEGFGLPVLEAMAAGTPVICSDAGALPELAGKAALIVPAKDTAALVQAIRHVLDDADLRRQLVARGYERVRQFTWQRAAQQTLQVLEQTFFGHQAAHVTAAVPPETEDSQPRTDG